MRVRRVLLTWCVGLIAVGIGAAAGEDGLAAGTSVRAGGSSVEAAAPMTDAAWALPSAAVEAGTGPASSVPAIVARSPAPATAGPGAPRPEAPPGSVPTATTTTRPVVEPDGLMSCTVKVEDPGSKLPTGKAVAGAPAFPLFVENCRPIVGDAVTVLGRGTQPGEAVRVSFGDGTSAGNDPSDPSSAMPSGQVRSDHRYQRPGRYLLERTSWVSCERHPPTILRVWIDVAAGRVPQAAGAAACHGLGPVKAGEPPRTDGRRTTSRPPRSPVASS